MANNHWSVAIAPGSAATPAGRVYNHFLDLNQDGDTMDTVAEHAIHANAGGPRDVNGDGDMLDPINEQMDFDNDGVPDWADGLGITIETGAYAAEFDVNDRLADQDWGASGKQHRTIAYDD